MRILVLSNMYPAHMGGTFVHTQVKHIANLGNQVEVIAPSAYWPALMPGPDKLKMLATVSPQSVIDGVPVYYPKYLRIPGKWFHPLSCYTQLAAIKKILPGLLERFEPDLIHAHSATAPGYIGLILKKKYNLPLVCSIRGSDVNSYPYYGKSVMYMTKKVIMEADQVISVSQALKSAAHLIASPRKEIKVIYNGCESGLFTFRNDNRQATRKSLGINENARVVVFVGTIAKTKGVLDLLTAFKKINKKKKNVFLLIAGEGPELLMATQFIHHNSAGTNIRLLGQLSHDEIVRHLNASDIFVLPSHLEGLPNSILEAMSCGLPVVATRTGGIPEAVLDGTSGLLVNVTDTAGLAAAIEILVHNEDLSRNMGREGREIILKKFQWKNNAEEIMKVYRRVLTHTSL